MSFPPNLVKQCFQEFNSVFCDKVPAFIDGPPDKHIPADLTVRHNEILQRDPPVIIYFNKGFFDGIPVNLAASRNPPVVFANMYMVNVIATMYDGILYGSFLDIGVESVKVQLDIFMIDLLLMLFLQADEGISRLESENSLTRKGRSRGKITRESTDQNSDIVWRFVLRFVVVVMSEILLHIW